MEHVKKDLGEVSTPSENSTGQEMQKEGLYKKIAIQNFNFITSSNQSGESIKDTIEKERKDSGI